MYTGVLVPTLVILFSSSIWNSVFPPAEGTTAQTQIGCIRQQLQVQTVLSLSLWHPTRISDVSKSKWMYERVFDNPVTFTHINKIYEQYFDWSTWIIKSSVYQREENLNPDHSSSLILLEHLLISLSTKIKNWQLWWSLFLNAKKRIKQEFFGCSFFNVKSC